MIKKKIDITKLDNDGKIDLLNEVRDILDKAGIDAEIHDNLGEASSGCGGSRCILLVCCVCPGL